MTNSSSKSSGSSGPSSRSISVRGAREHNLQDVDVDIPRDALVVFSGVSGSGKSSLAFGTIYAEAQRRYLESVAPYARRLIDQVGVPDVTSIDGLPPAVALQQQRGRPSLRSSVGSVTTLSSLLRMLYSRAGNYPPNQPMLFAEDFTPNTPQGACPHCRGVGKIFDVDEKTMVPDDSLSIREKAIASWPTAWQGQNLRDILVSLGYNVDKPWRDLPKKDRDWILFTQEQPTAPVYAGFTPAETRAALKSKMEPSYQGTFIGARKYIFTTYATTHSDLMKRRVARFMVGTVCPVCDGKRLKKEALSVTFAGYDIGELSRFPMNVLSKALEAPARGEFNLTDVSKPSAPKGKRRIEREGHANAHDVKRTANMSEEKRIAAQRICADLLSRLTTFIDLGLGYLSLDRSTLTLSPGELQRLRLGTQIRSNLFGVVYVLDEPSAGLHPADSHALFDALLGLRDSGNTVFVVEHDLEMMRRADWLVDVGPDAGELGGKVLYSGPPDGLRAVKESHTAKHLFDEVPRNARVEREIKNWLKLEGIQRNNLRGVDVEFPLSAFTTVTGVSGSGKSSLVSQALVDLVAMHLGHEPELSDEESPSDEPTVAETTRGRIASGAELIKRMVRVNQKPIGRTPRSNLATYTGLFDQVRQLFASTAEAKKKKFDAGHFSFNVAKGRCETCEGEGFVSIEMLFMPSVYAPCPTCHGARYKEKILEVSYREKNIAEVLGMTVNDAHEFFADVTPIAHPLKVLKDIGLGYLRLGQPATELSGGEAQRIKLATELQRTNRASTLYVLDEPTTGLHASDTDRLMAQLHQLVDAGHTVVVVEHDMRVAAGSDWVIDIGPGAGGEGGRVVAAGAPSAVASASASATAPYLQSVLKLATE